MWDGGNHMGRGWWWAMGVGWLIFLVLIGVVIVVVARHFTANGQRSSSAEAVLAERFARGEIDEDEYHKRREVLKG
jgi:putative membrane protein